MLTPQNNTNNRTSKLNMLLVTGLLLTNIGCKISKEQKTEWTQTRNENKCEDQRARIEYLEKKIVSLNKDCDKTSKDISEINEIYKESVKNPFSNNNTINNACSQLLRYAERANKKYISLEEESILELKGLQSELSTKEQKRLYELHNENNFEYYQIK